MFTILIPKGMKNLNYSPKGPGTLPAFDGITLDLSFAENERDTPS